MAVARRLEYAPAMTKLRDAVCPACNKIVTVTYWPFNVPLYAQHSIPGTERDCRLGLRPVEPHDAPSASESARPSLGPLRNDEDATPIS